MSVFFLTDGADYLLVLLDMAYTDFRTVPVHMLEVFVQVVLLVKFGRALVTLPLLCILFMTRLILLCGIIFSSSDSESISEVPRLT